MLLSKTSSSFDLSRKQELALQQYTRGEEISVVSSQIWQVYRGVVQLSKVRQDGTEIVLGWITADGAFGNYVDNSLTYRAVALSNVYVKQYFLRDIIKNPLLARQFFAQFSDRLIESQQLLAIVAVKSVEERLKQLLLMLRQKMGQAVIDGVRLQLRFTHQHLAEILNTTRVTITRILGSLQEKGLIYFDRDRHIVIVNSEIASFNEIIAPESYYKRCR